ncbi:MAG: hypothetical protein ACI9T8_000161 [Candidatus Saccharimonadales bacterium]|jgi:hypothetical protein
MKKTKSKTTKIDAPKSILSVLRTIGRQLLKHKVVIAVVLIMLIVGVGSASTPYHVRNNSFDRPVVTTSPVPDLLDNEYGYNTSISQPDYLTTSFEELSGVWWQYYVYWNDNSEATITRRDIGNNGDWEAPVNIHAALGGDILADDAHNTIGVGVDPEGYIHVLGNHHNDEMNYARSDNPYVIDNFSFAGPMIALDAATTEDDITYPQFVNNVDGDLLVYFRDRDAGSPATRKEVLNKWNPDVGSPGSWERMSIVTDDVESFYVQHIKIDKTGGPTHGRMHLIGTWREWVVPFGYFLNEDIVHIYSDDDGQSWYQFGVATPLVLPLKPADITQKVIDTDRPPNSSYILNVGGMTIDSNGHPHTVYEMSSTPGIDDPVIKHVYWDGASWQINTLDSMQPRGRPNILSTKSGEVFAANKQLIAGLYEYYLLNVTPGSLGYDSETIVLASDLIEANSEFLYDDNAHEKLGILSFHATRSRNIEPFKENTAQDSTVINVDLAQIDTLRLDSTLAPSLEVIINNQVQEDFVVSGSNFTNLNQPSKQLSQDPLNRPQYALLDVDGYVSDSSTVGEVHIRYESYYGTETIGLLEFSETGSINKKSVKLPLTAVSNGNIRFVARVKSGAGTFNVEDSRIRVYRSTVEPFPLKTDSDGSVDRLEIRSINNGDSNGDGTEDRLQASVASIADSSYGYLSASVSDSATSANPSGITGTDCSDISEFGNATEKSVDVDSQFYYPLGLSKTTVDCSANGSTAYINLILNGDHSSKLDKWNLRSYDDASGTYSTVSRSDYIFGSVSYDGDIYTVVEIPVTDGSLLDQDSSVNGQIATVLGFAIDDRPDSASCNDAKQSFCQVISANPEWQVWKNSEPGGGGYFMRVSIGPDGTIIAASDLGGIFRSADNGQSWTQHGKNSGYLDTHVRSVAHHPTDSNIVLAGSSSDGIYLSENGGLTYSNVFAGEKICFIAAMGDTMYASQATAWNRACTEIIKSTDKGQTWSSVGFVDSGAHIMGIRINPTNQDEVILISTTGIFYDEGDGLTFFGMIESTDGGTSFNNIITDPIYDAEWKNDGTKLWFTTFLSGGAGSLYEKYAGHNSSHKEVNSNYGGQIWVPGGTDNTLRLIDQRFYDGGSPRHGVFESTNNGVSFTRKGVWPDNFEFAWKEGTQFIANPTVKFGFSKTDPNAAAYFTAQQVVATFDGGNTFSQLNSYSSRDGWNSTGANNTVPVTVAQHPLDRNYVISGLSDMGCFLSNDAGSSWEYCGQDEFNGSWGDQYGGNIQAIVMDPDDINKVWMASGRGTDSYIIKSTNKGVKGSWFDSGTGIPANTKYVNDIVLDSSSPAGSRTLFSVVGGDIYRTTDDGDSWSLVFACGDCHRVEVDPESNLVAAGGNTGLYVSTASGDSGSWSNIPVSTFAGATPVDIRITQYVGVSDVTDNQTNANEFWFTLKDSSGGVGGVYRYQSGVVTLMEAEDTARTVEIDNSGDIYYGSSNAFNSGNNSTQDSRGVRYSKDNGASWIQLIDPLEYPFVADIVIPDGDQEVMWVNSPGMGVMKVYKYPREGDLDITVSDGTVSVGAGSASHTYTTTVTNNSAETVNEFKITQFPELSKVSVVQTLLISSGPGLLANVPGDFLARQWTGTLLPGQSVDMTYLVDVTGSAGESLSMGAVLHELNNTEGNLYETDISNNSATDSDTVVSYDSDISSSVDDSLSEVIVGATDHKYSVLITNNGPSSIDSFEMGMIFDAGTASYSSGPTIVSGGGNLAPASFVSWAWSGGQLDSGESVEVEFEVDVTGAIGQLLDINISVSSLSYLGISVQDNDGTNDNSNDTTLIKDNNSPNDIEITGTSADENNTINQSIGDLSSVDADDGDTHTHSLVSGVGDADNSLFRIQTDQLQITTVADYETKSSYSVRVRSTDNRGGTYDEVLIIDVNDVNATPTDLTISSNTVDEGRNGLAVGSFSTVDDGEDGVLLYSLVNGSGDDDNASFKITNSQLLTDTELADGNYSIRAQVSDGAHDFQESFTIEVQEDSVSPSVTIDEPTSGLDAGSSISIKLSASDNIGIDRVVIKVNGSTLSTDYSSPYSYTLNTALFSIGSHTIQAITYDYAGNSASDSVTFNIPGGVSGDVDSDGDVDIFDLSIMLSNWGGSYPAADFSGNGVIDIFDLSTLLSRYGT